MLRATMLRACTSRRCTMAARGDSESECDFIADAWPHFSKLKIHPQTYIKAKAAHGVIPPL